MSEDEYLPGTESMKCAMGLYEGSRRYIDGPFKGHVSHGVFSKVDLEDNPCTGPVRAWCKWRGNFAWLACDNPEHQKEAEVILRLDGKKGKEYIAFLLWQQNPFKAMPEILRNVNQRSPFLDAPKRVIEVKALTEVSPSKKCIPRNKGSKAKRRRLQIQDKEK